MVSSELRQDTHTSAEELTKEMTGDGFAVQTEWSPQKYYDAYPDKQDKAEAPAQKAAKTGKVTVRKTWPSLHNAKKLG